VTDDTGAISLVVPEDFAFVDGAPDLASPQILASIAEGPGLNEPAISVRLHADGTLNEVLAENGPALVGECAVIPGTIALPHPPGYEGLLLASPIVRGDLAGAYMVYEACFGDSTAVVEVAFEVPGRGIVIIQMFLRKDRDLFALDSAVETLTIN